jgi:hypothetical protein
MKFWSCSFLPCDLQTKFTDVRSKPREARHGDVELIRQQRTLAATASRHSVTIKQEINALGR